MAASPRERRSSCSDGGYGLRDRCLGVVATLAMDLWQRFLQAMGVPSGNWGLVGRWVAGFPRGVFVNRQITAAPKVRGEVAIGWAFHYAVGIAYAGPLSRDPEVGLRVACRPWFPRSCSRLRLLVAPWFAMQPALGMGFMAANTPKPATVRAVNVSVHVVFGLGLYLGASPGPPPRLPSVLLHREHRAGVATPRSACSPSGTSAAGACGGEGARYKDLLVERPA